MKSIESWVVCYVGGRRILRIHTISVILPKGTAVFAGFLKTKINSTQRYGGRTTKNLKSFVYLSILSFKKREKTTVPLRSF